MLKTPITLPIFYNSEGAAQLEELGVIPDLEDCDLRDMDFYIINAVGEYTEDGNTYTSIVSGSEIFICYLSKSEVTKRISKSLNL